MNRLEVTVSPDMQSISKLAASIEEYMEAAGVSIKQVNRMNIAVDEIYSNIVHYSRATQVKVQCEVKADTILVTFTDNGIPYNPLEEKEPDTQLAAEERELGGLGIFMTRKLMSRLDYEYLDQHNIVKLTLNRE